jgi:hypothetical protein
MEDKVESTEPGTATSAVPKKRTRKPATKSKTALKDELREARQRIRDLESKAPAIIVKPSEEETVTFFTEMDLNEKGKIKNAYPSHYNRRVRQNLLDEIDRLERQEHDATMNPNLAGHLGIIKQQLSSARDTLSKMDESIEKLRVNKDVVSGIRKSLGEKIRESMPTLSDMHNRRADPHDEAEKMVGPCIRLSDKEASVAVRNGIQVGPDKMVSRTSATMLWQWAGNALGETRDAETLRKD